MSGGVEESGEWSRENSFSFLIFYALKNCKIVPYYFAGLMYEYMKKWMETSMDWSEVAQSCPTLCDSMDCSPPGSSIHEILQAKILEWVAISFSKGSSQARDQKPVSPAWQTDSSPVSHLGSPQCQKHMDEKLEWGLITNFIGLLVSSW